MLITERASIVFGTSACRDDRATNAALDIANDLDEVLVQQRLMGHENEHRQRDQAEDDDMCGALQRDQAQDVPLAKRAAPQRQRYLGPIGREGACRAPRLVQW